MAYRYTVPKTMLLRRRSSTFTRTSTEGAVCRLLAAQHMAAIALNHAT
eukprot:CAMPEP_0119495052 /NCGR_PEP_ID=MMETSP1344-20130328/18811_1 /TAXON_ID=236787 /ORGANISM="Florenciella parvula, Strain CCMP2471" /LENGTH=47 /DNA_ID= /DNA_START= /DNA_END= /DNA_ORIENTATION=